MNMMYGFFWGVDYILTTSYQKNFIFKAFHEKKCYFFRKISFKTVFFYVAQKSNSVEDMAKYFRKGHFQAGFYVIDTFLDVLVWN